MRTWLAVVDLVLCCAALLLGTPLALSQCAGFIAVAAMVLGVQFRLARLHPAIWLGAAVLALCLRGGAVRMAAEVWEWPAYAAAALGVALTSTMLRAAQKADVEMRFRALVGTLVAYAFLLRLVYGSQVELLPEETYYWNYSRHLDIGYLDHPPLVAWLIRTGTALFGNGEFGVRFPALCCGGVASYYVFRLTENLFGRHSALWALALAQVLPFFFLAGMLMTPDAPLTAAWAASLYYLERALIAGRARSWAGVGICLGLGLLAKYSVGLLAASALAFMLFDAPSRRWFRRAEPYAALAIAAALFLPVLWWNVQHHWASFAFQTARRLAERPRFSLHKLVASAVVLLAPAGLLTFAGALRTGPPLPADPASPQDRGWRLLRMTVLAPVAFFLIFSLRHEVKLDWTGAPWVAALPMMAYWLAEAYGSQSGMRRWLRYAWPGTALVLLLMFGAGFYYLVLGLPGVGYSSHTELLPVEWREFGRQIDVLAADLRQRNGAASLVVGMDRYAIASELAFYSRDQSEGVAGTSSGHLFGDVGLMYEQWFPADRQAGLSLLLVAWDPRQLAATRLQAQAAALEPVHAGALVRDGSVVRRYYYRVVHGYRPFPSGVG